MIYILIALVMFACLGWVAVCNHRTFLDRKAMIDSWGTNHENFWERVDTFNKVTYDQHLYARILCRNPMELYK